MRNLIFYEGDNKIISDVYGNKKKKKGRRETVQLSLKLQSSLRYSSLIHTSSTAVHVRLRHTPESCLRHSWRIAGIDCRRQSVASKRQPDGGLIA